MAETTIGLTKNTKEKLANRGNKGETFEEIILKLIGIADAEGL